VEYAAAGKRAAKLTDESSTHDLSSRRRERSNLTGICFRIPTSRDAFRSQRLWINAHKFIFITNSALIYKEPQTA
jgi:hypothetical protein